MRRNFLLKALVVCSLLLVKAEVRAQVLTYHNDNARTGQNTQETVLNPSNVQASQFGKLFSQPVDGQIYAQPLYVPNLSIGNGIHNVVFVATEGDSVYAFDGDDNSGSNASPIWQKSLIDTFHGASSGATTVTSANVGNGLLTPQIGITGTPVIDLVSGTMYVDAYSYEPNSSCGLSYVHRLHALDIYSGKEKSPGPICIQGSVGTVSFQPVQQLNRPGLLLSNGTVYVAFGSHDDNKAHGWIFAYNAATFAQINVFLTTTTPSTSPTNGLGSIWMAGAGPSADSSGNIFFTTGNGSFDGVSNFADSLLKLSPNATLADYFTPCDQSMLDNADWDLASGGVLLLPNQSGVYPHLLVAAGKEGTIYLVNRDAMGGNCTGQGGTDNVIQKLPPPLTPRLGGYPKGGDGMFGMPAYWNNSLYLWAPDDVMKAFSLSNGTMGSTPSTSTDSYPWPGANLSISSNGNTNGIVWSLKTCAVESQASWTCLLYGPAILAAHDASNISSSLLYSSDQNSLRDNSGFQGVTGVKFSVPTVANGKVYVGTTNQLSVYGLNPHSSGPWVAIDRLFW
jgi:hypothetical protein